MRCSNAGWYLPKCRRGLSPERAISLIATGSSPGSRAGAVIVEAAPRSGSLITARLAAEAGREVMAVPGSPLDPRAQGCNQLIRDGATLVQNAGDVVEALGPVQARVESPAPRFEPSVEEPDVGTAGNIEELLGPSPVPVDEIIRLSGSASGAVQMALLELDLAGRLERHAGGRVSLRLRSAD